MKSDTMDFFCLQYGALFNSTNGGVIFFTYLFYAIALIWMMFAISTLFNNANLALTAGLLVHLVSFFAPNGIFWSDPNFYV